MGESVTKAVGEERGGTHLFSRLYFVCPFSLSISWPQLHCVQLVRYSVITCHSLRRSDWFTGSLAFAICQVTVSRSRANRGASRRPHTQRSDGASVGPRCSHARARTHTRARTRPGATGVTPRTAAARATLSLMQFPGCRILLETPTPDSQFYQRGASRRCGLPYFPPRAHFFLLDVRVVQVIPGKCTERARGSRCRRLPRNNDTPMTSSVNSDVTKNVYGGFSCDLIVSFTGAYTMVYSQGPIKKRSAWFIIFTPFVPRFVLKPGSHCS